MIEATKAAKSAWLRSCFEKLIAVKYGKLGVPDADADRPAQSLRWAPPATSEAAVSG